MKLQNRPTKVLNVDTDTVVNLVYNPINNTYLAAWDGTVAHYDADVIHRQIEVGILEVIEEEILIEKETENMNAPETFYFTAFSDPQLYFADKLINGDEYIISWFDNKTGKYGNTEYSTASVINSIETGNWKLRELNAFDEFGGLNDGTETEELTFGGIELEQAWWDEEFNADEFVELFPEDEDELTTDEVTLADIREFTADTGAIIEVDADFFTVRYEGATYTAVTAAGLQRVTQAIRTLEAASA